MPLAGHLLRLQSSATWVCLLPCNSSLWCESCLFISEPAQPQAQWSKDKDKCQATCVHHCCTACSSWLWRTPKRGVSAESWEEAGAGAGLRAPPSLRRSSVSLPRLGASFDYPIRLGSPSAAGPVSPPTGQSFSEHRDLFSLSFGCEEKQRVCTVVEGMALSDWALYFFHHAIV